MSAARDARTRASEPVTSVAPSLELPAPAGAQDHEDDLAVLCALAARADAQMGAENFPVALRLLPRGPRADLATVYRFARFVDDVGDEAPADPPGRERLLDLVAADVAALAGAQPGGAAQAPALAPVAALRPLVARTGMPLETFTDLLEANRVDQRVGAYETFDDLLGYCRLSAAPVGRAVLYVAGAVTERNIADSDAVCAALQVLEHCQDVGEDARAGRVYLPAEELRAAGVDRVVLSADVTPPLLRGVVARQAARARDLLGAGLPLVARLSGWARIAVAGYVAGGLATADALERADHDVLARAVRPSKATTGRHAAVLLARAVRRRDR